MSSMNSGMPLGPMPQHIPGRVISRVQRYPMPDGTVREKQWVQVTYSLSDGTYVTEERAQVVPPLDDGVVPDDMTDVIYCRLCRAMMCRSVHSFKCQNCGQTFCVRCRVRVERREEILELCEPCAKDMATPKLIKLFRKMVWDE